MKISPKIYAQSVYDVYERDSSSETIHRFLKLLKKKNSLKLLPKIFVHLQKLEEEKNKTKIVKIKSARDLSEDEKNRLIDILEKKLNKKIKLEIWIDKNILGGLVIQVDDRVYDGSLKNKIKKLREKIIPGV